ncbi:MAG: hypothetical protein JW915_06710 [Chitinispirillaceae bacterium]|nr:hypothetical protein [Chitinispirillaceae bacterium]
MNIDYLRTSLIKLAKLYADSAWNYERAIVIIQDEELKNELAKMHNNHIEHLERINLYIRDFGGGSLQAELSEDLSEEMEVITDDLSEEEIIFRLKKGEKAVAEKLQDLLEIVEIPELIQNLEEDLEDEDVYINTLRNFS